MGTETVKKLLNELSWIRGVTNDIGASNDVTCPLGPWARKELIRQVVMAVSENYDKLYGQEVRAQGSPMVSHDNMTESGRT